MKKRSWASTTGSKKVSKLAQLRTSSRRMVIVGLYPTDAGSQLLLLAHAGQYIFNLKYSTSITRQNEH